MATKFINLTSFNGEEKSSETIFKYQVDSTSGNTPKIMEASFDPDDFSNVLFIHHDNGTEMDVFLAWDKEMENGWIFYGTKGSEFK